MQAQITKKGNNLQIEPATALPAQTVLAKLSRRERRILERCLSEPAFCVFHNKFRRKSTVEGLFGSLKLRPGARPVFDDDQKIGAAVPALSATQECLAFERFNCARFQVYRILKQYHNKRLSAKATRDILFWADLAEAMRSRIIEINMPLVYSMAKRSRLGGLDFNELISEGNLALIRSAEKFDASRGFKFSTYACRAILKSFSRVAMKTSRYRGLFPVELNIEMERSDFVERKRVVVEEDCLDELKHILQANLADLNDVEQTVIKERFSLGALPEGVKYKTLEQVGTMIGVTKERVRQIQNKALQKIKVALEEQFLAA